MPNFPVYTREKINGFVAMLLIFILAAGYAADARPGIQIAPQQLTLLPLTVSNGQYGSVYKTLTIQASGGKSPYTFTVSAGSLPPGMTLSAAGVLSGTPGAAGKYSLTVTAQDAAKSPKTLTGSRVYAFTVDQADLKITAGNVTMNYGGTIPALTVSYSGFVNGDDASGLSTAPKIITAATTSSAPGVYPITVSGAVDPNYSISYIPGTLTVSKALQQISWTQSLLIGCNTATQLLLNATASSSLPVTYTVSDASVATVSGNVLTLVNPGTAVVTATQAGDADHAAATAVRDTVVYEPASLINQHWSDVIFFDNSGGDFVQWQWYKNGDSIAGATQPYYSETPSLKGEYYVVAMNRGGQEIKSCTLDITSDTVVSGGIKVFPNPTREGASVTVNGNYSGAALQGAVLQVVDLNGRVRQLVTAVQPSTTLAMPTQTGIYIINLLLSGGQKASTNVLVQ